MNASEIDLDSPAIKALGSLFKLTEVFLLDDGFPIDDNRQVSSCPKHIRFKYDDDDDDDDQGGKISSKSSIEILEESVVMEDVDISLEMSALGLPLTFQTSKQPSSVQSKEKHKLVQRKDQDSPNRLKDRILLSPNPNAESQTYAEFQDTSSSSSSLSMPDQAELSCSGFDVFDDTVRLSDSSDGEQPATVADVPRYMSCEVLIEDLLETDFQMENNISIAATSNLLERNTSCGRNIFNDCIIEHPKEIDRSLMGRVDAKGDQLGNAMQLDDLGSSMCIEQTQVAGMPLDSDMVLDNNANGNFSSSTVSGEWNAFWDSFYMRYYFYNSKTEESTWYPPPGMESFVYGDVSNTCDESIMEAISAVDPAFSQNEEQLDRHELDDKARFDERTEDKVFGVQAFTTQDLSSSSVMLSDKSYAVKLYDHRVLDGNYQTAITSSSSLSTINPYQNPENEREQEGSGGMSTSVSQSNNYDSVDSSCENANGDCSGNLIAQLSNSSSLSSVDEGAACDDNLINHAPIRKLEKEANGLPAATKQKTKRRNRRRKKSFNNNDDHEFQLAEEYYVDITKYWCQRYLLFSKFDVGIQMDEEGWFSVTPEAIARHHASRSGGGVVIDCFTGVGGNAIQFAKTSKHVIAIDIDPKKIDYAHHNASIYGVEGRIDFINGDSFSVAPTLKADTVFLSPPWGGPDYLKVKSYDISMLQPHDGQFLFNTFKATASLIIMFLPRNVDIVQLAELSLSSNTPWSLEVEKNYLNGKLKAVTAYFSKSS